MFLDVDTRALNQMKAEASEDEIRKRSEFKARAVHIVGEDWQTIQERQAVRRKQRVQLRKEQVGTLYGHLMVLFRPNNDIAFQMVSCWRSIVEIARCIAMYKH